MISVIVPIYNSIRYLNECVESILNQSFRDFELLLIDDGSSDGSGDTYNIYYHASFVNYMILFVYIL